MKRIQKTSRGMAALAAVILCCFCTKAAQGQTVRPVIVNYTGKASGSFELVNDSPAPLNVVLSPRSFDVDENGHPSYRPLDPAIHLKLSAMSFRIPPQQSYTVFYTATTDTVPAWFMIYANFTGFPKREQTSMAVQLEIPHVVYVSAKKPNFSKADVRVERARYVRSKKLVLITVSNTGSNLGRLEETHLVGNRKRAELGGGPLFPQKKRTFDFQWDGDTPPEKAVLKFDRFDIETALTTEE